MLGIQFKKAPPTTYVMQYVDGNLRRQGAGLSFWYFAPTSTLVDIPLASADVPFSFHEVTEDFQEVTIYGQVTFRIADPVRIAQFLDYTVTDYGDYICEDPEVLKCRIINTVQVLARSVIQRMNLPQALRASETLAAEVLPNLRAAESVFMLGVEILGLSVSQIKPTPEMARALEAAARESLQRQSDQAIYLRRNAAVEEERKIKESELNTEIVVEQKRRQIRETRMSADIALEEQRASLIDTQCENERKDADSKAYALETSLKPLRTMDWRTLMVFAAKSGDGRFAISLAFQQLAENARKIGQLTITPDLLNSLIPPNGK